MHPADQSETVVGLGGVGMAKSVFHARRDGTQFYLNTESSSPNTGNRNRYRLFKTENFGRD